MSGFYVDKCLAAGLKLTDLQKEVVNDIRRAGKIERRILSGEKKLSCASLQKKGLVSLIHRPCGQSYFELKL